MCVRLTFLLEIDMMLTPSHIKKLEAALKENEDVDIEELANKLLDPKKRCREYNFEEEFEGYIPIILDAIEGGHNKTILINQFDEEFGKRAIAKFKKLGYTVTLASKKRVEEWRCSDEEYEHKYSAFFISWR